MIKITRQDIIKYYRDWAGKTGLVLPFTNMLLKKATFALKTSQKVLAYGQLRTGKELELMFSIADDLACEGVIK